LFKDAPKVFMDQIEQVIRLIRSKGVGVFFCTQLTQDVPSTVLSQLGNRVHHVIRALHQMM
jgi:DNA helicase HerA-like ATPase